MKLGFTGSRQGMTERQRTALQGLADAFGDSHAEFHHGMCEGADTEASHIFKKFIGQVIGHPPTNEEKMDPSAFCDQRLEAKNYITRNHDIVDACDLLIAAPSTRTEVQRSGTWATIRYAEKIGRPCIILDR